MRVYGLRLDYPTTPLSRRVHGHRPCIVLVVARPPVDTHEWVSFEDEDEELVDDEKDTDAVDVAGFMGAI